MNMLICNTLICDDVYFASHGFYVTHVIIIVCNGSVDLNTQGIQSVNTVSGNQATFTPHYTTVLDL